MSQSSNAPLPQLKPRPRESHKGDFGRVLLIGGSRGMAGAISLAGMAALRGGAGLVTLAVPEQCLETVAGFEPSYMTVPLASDTAGRISGSARDEIRSLLVRADVVACGPGLGMTDSLADLVSWLYESVPQPMVVDADGLNSLATRPQSLLRPGGPRILTPHPKEFARLLGEPASGKVRRPISDDGVHELVAAHANEWKCVLLLKAHRTLISDGREIFENTTGNPGMATGGSGDVLTGLITALVGQGLIAAVLGKGLSPLEAARLGAHVHGRAGDLAAAELGEVSLIARDLIDFLPAALCEVSH